MKCIPKWSNKAFGKSVNSMHKLAFTQLWTVKNILKITHKVEFEVITFYVIEVTSKI